MIAALLLALQIVPLPSATQQPAGAARLIVTELNGGTTTRDYATLAECESARTRLIDYNKAKRKDNAEYMRVWAACVPL